MHWRSLRVGNIAPLKHRSTGLISEKDVPISDLPMNAKKLQKQEANDELCDNYSCHAVLICFCITKASRIRTAESAVVFCEVAHREFQITWCIIVWICAIYAAFGDGFAEHDTARSLLILQTFSRIAHVKHKQSGRITRRKFAVNRTIRFSNRANAARN